MINDKLKKAWEIRKANFSDNIYFYAPTIKRYETDEFKNSLEPYFVPISITGSSCALQCDHCKAKILKVMQKASDPESLFKLAKDLKEKGAKGLLISGGSDSNGVVPLIKFKDSLKKIKEELNLKILVHTGLVDRELAKALADVQIEAAMIDIIGTDETVKKVYHLSAGACDFENSLALLCEYGVKTAPHIVIGLHYGKIKGEQEALKAVSRYPVDCLVLVGLMPQFGTPMEEVTAPSSIEMAEIFADARMMFPRIPVLLGCERTYGSEKYKIEEVALEAGLNGIAYPSEGIIERSREIGLKPHYSELCCALLFENMEVMSVESAMALA